MKKICLASLRFSIGHIQILEAYCKLFIESGYELLVLFDDEYFKYLSGFEKYRITENQMYSCDVLWIYNPSPKNHILAKKAKKKGIDVYYVYHEPYPGLKEFLKNKKTLVRGLLATISSNLTSKYCRKVILPSKRCVYHWEQHSLKINRKYAFFPLIFDDVDLFFSEKGRVFFSFIGAFTMPHNCLGFIDFVKFASEKDANIKFMIATKTDISHIIQKDQTLLSLVEANRLVVHCGKSMTMEEINQYYSVSCCIWNNYTRCTQSGVLAHAFMNGTPSIASNLAAFTNYIEDKRNSIILKNGNNDEILYSYYYVKENYSTLADNIKKTYNECFNYKNQINRIKSIIEDY